VKEIRKKLGGTVNDVCWPRLPARCRRFLEGRGVGVDELPFRAQVAGEHSRCGGAR